MTMKKDYMLRIQLASDSDQKLINLIPWLGNH